MFLSVFDIFKIGIGPSSSHTMGPMTAAARFLDDLRGGVDKIPGSGALHAVSARLHGSLAWTGKGHATDRAVILGLCGLLPETLDPDQADALVAEVISAKQVAPKGLPALAFDPATDLVFDFGPPLAGHANGLMAVAGLCAALGGTNLQVENAAEIALEHHLGMTCDPAAGLVQVPCIERNALGSIKAVSAASLALRGDGAHFMPLDNCIRVMRDTGRDMDVKYKETSQGGIAVNLPEC